MAIITISRGSLSGGRALAQSLSSKLGYPNVGREVLQEAAEALGATEEAFRGEFETTPGLWGRLTKARRIYTLAVQTALAEWCTRGNLVYQDRSRWVKVMYGADVSDPSIYDIIVNLRTHTIESASETIACAAAQSRFQITDEVEAEIFAFAAECRDTENCAAAK